MSAADLHNTVQDITPLREHGCLRRAPGLLAELNRQVPVSSQRLLGMHPPRWAISGDQNRVEGGCGMRDCTFGRRFALPAAFCILMRASMIESQSRFEGTAR